MRAVVTTEAPLAGTWLTARRAVWLLAIVAAVVVALLAVRLTQSFIARRAVTNKVGIPVVSVTEVGRSAVPTTVSIIGTIAARYDTPTYTHVRYMSAKEPQSAFESLEELVALSAAFAVATPVKPNVPRGFCSKKSFHNCLRKSPPAEMLCRPR